MDRRHHSRIVLAVHELAAGMPAWLVRSLHLDLDRCSVGRAQLDVNIDATGRLRFPPGEAPAGAGQVVHHHSRRQLLREDLVAGVIGVPGIIVTVNLRPSQNSMEQGREEPVPPCGIQPVSDLLLPVRLIVARQPVAHQLGSPPIRAAELLVHEG